MKWWGWRQRTSTRSGVEEISAQLQRVLLAAGRPAQVQRAICDDAARRIARVVVNG